MIPKEFSEAYVTAQSDKDKPSLYQNFWRCGEPYASMFKNNPWLRPPDPKKPLEWGKGHYYDTTVARKHDYWKDKNLPVATKDIHTLRSDLLTSGYCLIEDGISPQQLATIKQRVHEQAETEVEADLAENSPALRIVWSRVNKGDCFVKCLEFDPEGVQSGPLIEQILNESLGKGWCHYSFISNIAFNGCYPQTLHQDQSAVQPLQTPEAPLLMNVVYLLEDVNEVNGGTLMIPGSHKILSQAGSGGKIGKLPPAINTEAKAGTIVLMDGRMLHGTGVNRSDKPRYILTNSCLKSWIRSQENWMLSVKPDVLEIASPKLLQRMGFQARVNENIVDGFGAGGSGHAGDDRGAIVKFRQALDSGNFVRVGELKPGTIKDSASDNWTVQAIRDALKRIT